LFFQSFLRHPRSVGALLPSTRALGEAMLAGLDLRAGDVVLEYGPGTGSLTEAILARSRAVGGLRYLGIEVASGFCRVLRGRMPEFEFVQAPVEDVARLVRERELPPPAAIISGLPLIFMPTMAQIVTTAHALLAPAGSFRTFSYLQSWLLPQAHRLRCLMREHFATFRHRKLVVRNFPPAFVYCGDKARP
jgi:phospholipid N-methyltransferase